MQKPESVEVGPPTAAPSQASHPRAAAWLGSRAMSPACFTGRRRRRCHGTSPAAAGEGQAARSGDASERGASSAGPSAAAARGWPLTEAPPPLSHLYLLAGGGARPLPSRWPVAGGRPEVARCPGLGHPVRGGAAARGSTATGRRQREEPTDDGEDGRDPGEKQEDAVGEVGEVVVASAKLEAKRRGRGGR